jgi:Malonate decarboxylase, alpha subunit, transporter
MLVPSRHQADRPARLARAAAIRGASGKLWPADRATELLEAIIESGDRVAIEGDNQKQADFLAAALAKVDPARIHDLHMVQSVLALPDISPSRTRYREPTGFFVRRTPPARRTRCRLSSSKKMGTAFPSPRTISPSPRRYQASTPILRLPVSN